MRGYTESVHVFTDCAGAVCTPSAFEWRGRRYRVTAVIDRWHERLPWWRIALAHPEQAPLLESEVWRIEATIASRNIGVFDLSRIGEQWQLLRIAD